MYDANGEQPARPERPAIAEPKSRSSLIPVAMVLVPVVVLAVGIVAFTGRAGLLILAAIASVPAFLLFHYLLWGYWLKKLTHDDDPREAGTHDTDS